MREDGGRDKKGIVSLKEEDMYSGGEKERIQGGGKRKKQ